MSSIFEYFDALERLKSGNPIRVEKGKRITKDLVALEAGRQRGSIKKSRPQFKKLIQEIENSQTLKPSKLADLSQKLSQEKAKSDSYRKKYESLLGEYMMLIEKLQQLTR